MRKRGQATFSEALEKLLGGLDSATKVREGMAIAYWDRVVGPMAAAATRVESVRDGVMWVRTKSSVWSQELTLLKETIVRRLNQLLGHSVIRDIRFRAQGVEAPESFDEPVAPFPTDEELAALPLSPEEQEFERQEVAAANQIPDDRFRQSTVENIVRSHRIRIWRLKNGWKHCETCTAIHDTPETRCPVCRLHG